MLDPLIIYLCIFFGQVVYTCPNHQIFIASHQIVFCTICEPFHHQQHRFPFVLNASSHICCTLSPQGSNAPLHSPCGPQGEDRPSRKAATAHPHGENGKAGSGPDKGGQPLSNHSVFHHKAPEKRKQKKINIDEAEGKKLNLFLLSCFCSFVALIQLTPQLVCRIAEAPKAFKAS